MGILCTVWMSCVCVCVCKRVERKRTGIAFVWRYYILIDLYISRLCVYVCVRVFVQVWVNKFFLHDLLAHLVLPDSSACLDFLVLCTYIGSLTVRCFKGTVHGR